MVFVVVLVVWEVSLLAFGIQSFLIPRPSVIAASLVADWPTLAGVAFTGTEAVGGLIVGVALGTVGGLATARWATARELLPAGRDRGEHDPDHRLRADHPQLVRSGEHPAPG